ncbi:MAG: hypothetical protein KatS3mg031_2935 [Chitinophagales bacterium]|nr:MAG: hypothetical protein KatS3mg031_2935 [Chitinophagales bacterium]
MSCEIRKIPLGVGNCIEMPSLLSSMIVTPDNFSVTEANLNSKTFWQNAVKADPSARIHVWPYFDMFENISEEAVYEDTPLSYQAVRDGNYRFRFSIAQGLCLHKAMFTHRAKSGRVFLVDVDGQVICTKGSDGLYRGLSIQLLNTEKLQFNDGSVTTKSPIVLALRNNKELDRDGYIFTSSWFYELVRLKDVTIEVVSVSASSIVVDVYVTCDKTAVNGLVAADFILLDSGGSAQTFSLSAGPNGRYTLSGTFVDGTLTLKPPATLSIDAYEHGAPITIDVP